MSKTSMVLKRTNLIKEDCQIRWHSDYWDGALSGVCFHKGKIHWFDIKCDYMSAYFRRNIWRTYWVFEMTPEQEKCQLFWHNEFRTHVGDHTEYTFSEEKMSLGRYNHFKGNMDYCKEMFYEPKKAWDIENPGFMKMKRTQLVGWTNWDVLTAQPYVEYRPTYLL